MLNTCTGNEVHVLLANLQFSSDQWYTVHEFNEHC